MKTEKYLCKHTGEYVHTAKSPIGVVNYVIGTQVYYIGTDKKEHVVDIDSKQMCILGYDNWMQVETFMYEIRDIQIPDWLKPLEYLNIRMQVELKYFAGRGGNLDWSENTVRKLLPLGGLMQYVCIKLLNTKSFRSKFRESCTEQLKGWIRNPSPKYPTPFSTHQLNALAGPRDSMNVERIDNTLYHHR